MKNAKSTKRLISRNHKLARAVMILATTTRVMLDGLEAIAIGRGNAKSKRKRAAATIKTTRAIMDVEVPALQKRGK